LPDEVGAPVPLTGRYSIQGARVRAGLELWAAHNRVRLVVLDDGSDPGQSGRLHDQLVRRGCRFVLGPYGSDSTRALARAAPGRLVWNHGAAADDVQRLPGVVSVSAPASGYLVALGRAVAQLRPRARVAVAPGPGRFAAFAAEGLERRAAALGIDLVNDLGQAEVVLACGPVRWEIDLFHRIGTGRLLLGGVSPGLTGFPQLLGDDPEGLLAPVQWHPQLPVEPALGPATVDLDDYIAAQTYATCLIADHCLELEPDNPLAAARQLRTTTFFGDFQLGTDGRQTGHRLSVVQWRRRRPELLPSQTPPSRQRSSRGARSPRHDVSRNGGSATEFPRFGQEASGVGRAKYPHHVDGSTPVALNTAKWADAHPGAARWQREHTRLRRGSRAPQRSQ
jgi:hypothetical protein